MLKQGRREYRDRGTWLHGDYVEPDGARYVYVDVPADSSELHDAFYVGECINRRLSRKWRRPTDHQETTQEHGLIRLFTYAGQTELESIAAEKVVFQLLSEIGADLTNGPPGGRGPGIGNPNHGMKREEVVDKVRGDNHYMKKNPEARANHLAAMLGDNNPMKRKEVIEKVREKLLGDNNPMRRDPEARANLRAAMNRPFTKALTSLLRQHEGQLVSLAWVYDYPFTSVRSGAKLKDALEHLHARAEKSLNGLLAQQALEMADLKARFED